MSFKIFCFSCQSDSVKQSARQISYGIAFTLNKNIDGIEWIHEHFLVFMIVAALTINTNSKKVFQHSLFFNLSETK